jgi:scyllo-inositol 2-dehydrogenase (NADP+)
MKQPLNVALIGYGFGGRVFHAPPIARTEGLRLAAIVSKRKAEIARDHPGVAVVSSPEAVFADPTIDLVAISTPNTAHFDLAARALAAGKHVVVDKPFTVTGAEARELARRAEAAGRMLTVFHNFRYYADFLALKQLIAGGVLGDIVYFESHFDRYVPAVPDAWREKPGPGAGTWWDLGPHLLDQALQLFGRPLALQADMAVQRGAGGATDYFHVLLRYEKLRVVLTSCFLAAADDLRFVVHGSKASLIKHGIDSRDGVDPKPGTLVFGDGSRKAAPAGRADERAFYAAVREAIAGMAPNPVPLEDAIAVMDLLEAADVSAAERREVML